MTSATGINYMAHLYAKVRADGITVPIYHNDKGRNGDWVPGSFPTPDSNYLYAFDGYPSASGAPPDWGYYGPGGAKGGASASPTTPGFEAEFGGGFFDPWGGAPWQGQGYSFERAFDGPAYERQFYLTNVANGIKLQNVYMTFGGTSWGWLPASVVYTSYDYGAAISEARQLTAKIPAMKELGYFLQVRARHQQDRPGQPGRRVEFAAGDLPPGQSGHRHPVLLRPQRSHAGPDLHPAGQRGRTAPTPCRSPARCNWTART